MSKNQHTLNLLNIINKNVNNINIIKKKQSILISISGGQDSICLFFIFIQLKKQWEWSFGIIYCNHLWQTTSFATGSSIIKIAYLFKIPIYYAITTSAVFSEENSRHWRYKMFYRILFFYNYKIITTGHTSSDKVETVLFQFIRGASPKNFLCLNDIKYFSSNNKFTKNSKITNVSLFYIKNLNFIGKFTDKNYKSKDFILFKISILYNFKYKKQSFPSISTRTVFYGTGKLFISFKTQPYKFFHRNYFIISSFFNFNYNSNLENFKVLNKEISEYNYTNNFILKKSFLIRPILLLDRFDLKKLLLFFNIPIYPDDSNQKKIYYRNRIRKELLPTLKFFFNPQINTSLYQFSVILLEEQFHLNLLLKELVVEFYSTTEKYFILNIVLFIKLPKTIQRKLIKNILEHYTKNKIGFHNVEKILDSLNKPCTGGVQTPWACILKMQSLRPCVRGDLAASGGASLRSLHPLLIFSNAAPKGKKNP